ncbi:hypothetical protein [Dyadobacter psychrophilus]|uniref:Uncharacterized protein n=1 Tax=Dyadobacter psychrophilus TaxID=651661 RepID=A0A1T5E471_9BACT|nr:hypothetical protein [Dyadobacter psychrophilus]SKB78606.1 hypothetical protein SAMN05660293_02140 [Dyadobacter psychrophilus]
MTQIAFTYPKYYTQQKILVYKLKTPFISIQMYDIGQFGYGLIGWLFLLRRIICQYLTRMRKLHIFITARELMFSNGGS